MCDTKLSGICFAVNGLGLILLVLLFSYGGWPYVPLAYLSLSALAIIARLWLGRAAYHRRIWGFAPDSSDPYKAHAERDEHALACCGLALAILPGAILIWCLDRLEDLQRSRWLAHPKR